MFSSEKIYNKSISTDIELLMFSHDKFIDCFINKIIQTSIGADHWLVLTIQGFV